MYYLVGLQRLELVQIDFCLVEVFLELADSIRVSNHFLNRQLIVLDLLG